MTDTQFDRSGGNLFNEILRRIPGFAGYVEQSERRENEQRARLAIANHLDQAKRAIDVFARKLVDAGKLDQAPACERLRGRLDMLATRLRSVPSGSSRFFSQSRIEQETLEDLYEYDLWLIDESAKLATRLHELADGSAEELTLPKLQEQVVTLESKWSDRQKLLEQDP